MPYIYLIREREFINAKQHVYKLGKSAQQQCRRMSSYPKGSEIEMILRVVDHTDIEGKLLKIFNEKFTNRSDIRREYFEGDSSHMTDEIFKFKVSPIVDGKKQPIDVHDANQISLEHKVLDNENLYLQIQLEQLKQEQLKQDIQPVIEQDQKTRTQKHREWIIDNPPNIDEPSSKYYNRLKLDISNPLYYQGHAKILRSLGYVRHKNMNGAKWTK